MSSSESLFDCLNSTDNIFVVNDDSPFIFDGAGYGSTLIVGEADLGIALERKKKYGEYFLLVTCPQGAELPDGYEFFNPSSFFPEFDFDDNLYATISDRAHFQNIAISPSFVQKVSIGHDQGLRLAPEYETFYSSDLLKILLQKRCSNEKQKRNR